MSTNLPASFARYIAVVEMLHGVCLMYMDNLCPLSGRRISEIPTVSTPYCRSVCMMVICATWSLKVLMFQSARRND